MYLVTDTNAVFNLVKKHLPGNVRICDSEADGFIYRAKVIQLELNLDHDPVLSTVTDVSCQLNRRVLDPLRKDVRMRFLRANALTEGSRVFDLTIIILQCLENIVEFEDKYSHKISKHDSNNNALQKWKAAEVTDWSVLTSNPFGLDASSVQEVAFNYLKKTPQQIADAIPSQFRVVHIEPILRHDLAKRFQRCQAQFRQNVEACTTDGLRSKLAPNSKLEGCVKTLLARRQIIDDMLSPRITFHGTNSAAVYSIVRHGFKLPGKLVDGKIVASPRSGVVFDRGIYSSPSSLYAISYAKGQYRRTPIGSLPAMRLIVCATLMGRTCSGRFRNEYVHGPLIDGHDSHYDGGFEYMTYDERAILPCYVIHLDLGSEAAKQAIEEAQEDPNNIPKISKPHPRLVQEFTAPGDIKREKERKKAAAMKWFSGGFGTAKGTSFVIEEIGEIDDDEEDYGDWQAEKHAFTHKDRESEEFESEEVSEASYNDWDENGNVVKRKGLFMDQYQRARNSQLFQS